ncbi:MAG: PUR family DNA/RNA-binding protein [Bacteroidia bacterium]|nr:PUR family DNA/RNA-binding protein [Bacteroidia bacterium]
MYSHKVRAGKRTYIIDVRATRTNDYYITITERKRRFDGEGYDKQKIHLYKEDFNKFVRGLTETVEYVKNELMPHYNYDRYDDGDEWDDDERY